MKTKSACVLMTMVLTVTLVKAQDLPPKHSNLLRFNAAEKIIAELIKPLGNLAAEGKVIDVTINEKKYRFYENKKFDVLNPTEEIVFYRIYEPHGKATLAKYFFGKQASAIIKPLTIKNLKIEFPDEKEFHAKLDLLAHNDFQLVKYFYCINRIRFNSAHQL